MRLRSFLPLTSLLLPSLVPAAEVQYNRDVRPILSDKCFACHGFDPKNRKGDRRIDTLEGATAEIEGIRAIVPGDLEKSDAWARILSTEKDEVMPPPKSHKKLSAEEKETIKLWIEQGAKYQKHWAFEAPSRPALPPVQDPRFALNPIDRFVGARLESAGLQPAPEADPRTLVRRLSLDLTGLPPSPQEVEAFVQDTSADAYTRLVERLMAKPQWGEHRGRYWLDAARYADTHGLHFDNYREMWPYRDWVINAFNQNQPFDQFTLEQIAGDLLPNPSREQLIATGFHRCNATTNEGGTIDDENLAFYANDRVTTTAWVWLGLTANCAACHDHKFDPITTKDFYSMAAFFRNTTQGPKDGNIKDSKPIVYLPKSEDSKRFGTIDSEITATAQALKDRRTQSAPEFEIWLTTAKAEDAEVSSASLELHLPLTEGEGVEVKGESNSEPYSVSATGPIEWVEGGKYGKAPSFTNNSHFQLGDLANFDTNQPFSAGCWVLPPKGDGALIARMDDRKGLQGWELFSQGGKFGAQLACAQPKGALRVTSKNKVIREGKWQHVLITYDGTGKSDGFRLFLDGKPQPLAEESKAVSGSCKTNVELRLAQRENGSKLGGAQLQDVRVYGRELSTGEARSLFEEKTLQAALKAVEKRTAAQKEALLNFYLDNLDELAIKHSFHLEALEEERTEMRLRATVSHVQEEKKTNAMANILMRGAYDKLGEQVPAAGFSALHPFPADAPKNRLGLAQWLIAPQNPLTARVTVNRFWQELFGTGLVRTSEDLGTQGDPPSHPELLDWLAVEFRESGWNVKHLFSLMVNSATYRQSAASTKEKLEKDPQNRLLSRGPRFRMDAESVRDYALSTSGLLVRTIGGPSVRPYQPEGVWEAVAMPGSDTRVYKRDTGEALYRRSLYTFWKRSAPPATMDIFNAPSRESCTVRRERTNTPLQALATLNDPQFVEAARALAQVCFQQSNQDFKQAVEKIAAQVLLRPLTEIEREIVFRNAAELETQFKENPAGAQSFLTVGELKADERLPKPELAALTMIANQLLNLDEALNK